MSQTSFLLIILLSFMQAGFAQSDPKDSCEIKITEWFQPGCRVDTCINVHWGVSYNESCNITKVLYKVYDLKKTKLIYRSDTVWTGTKNPDTKDWDFKYYDRGYYPYEITFYTKDNKTIKRKGKVLLHIW